MANRPGRSSAGLVGILSLRDGPLDLRCPPEEGWFEIRTVDSLEPLVVLISVLLLWSTNGMVAIAGGIVGL